MLYSRTYLFLLCPCTKGGGGGGSLLALGGKGGNIVPLGPFSTDWTLPPIVNGMWPSDWLTGLFRPLPGPLEGTDDFKNVQNYFELCSEEQSTLVHL